MIPGHAVDNALKAAARVGAHLESYQARAIAEAVLSYAEERAQHHQMAHRHQWENPDFREYLRQRMRHELLEMITKQGLVPVSLPAEKVRYMAGGFLDPDAVAEVPEQADWRQVVVTLEVGARVPPVDREAAVKAGVLTGPPA